MRGRLTKAGFESAAGLSLLMLSACSGEAIDPSAAPDPSVALDRETSPAEPSLAGTWTATVSSPAFVSNPKQLRLELDAAGRGTLLVGDERLPVPSDPAVGSPPEALSDAGEATGMLLHLYEGVEYSLVHVRKDSGSLSFALDALEAFEPVCAQAVPLLTDVGYRCLENWGGSVERSAEGKRCSMTDPDSGAVREVDCLMLYRCNMDPMLGCRCTESSCRVSNSGAPIQARFDLTLSDDGSSLIGPHDFDFLADPPFPGDVTFTRQAD